MAPGQASEPVTGWMSRFDIAARTKRRIVLYGNVLDWVMEQSEGSVQPLLLVDWIRRRLAQLGYERVVRFNHSDPARVVLWEADLRQGQQQFEALLGNQPRDVSDPATALRLMQVLLRDPAHRAAVILENAELRYDAPSLESVLLRQLVRDRGDETVVSGLAVHLYAAEAHIPRDFISAESDAALILVSSPSFTERQTFFARLPQGAALLAARERGVEITLDRLARVTEGYRLRELDQLRELAESQPRGAQILTLLSIFRHGRKVDYWVRQEVSQIRASLHDRIKGQDEAIEEIVDSVYRAKHRIGAMIDDSTRTPAMILFFVGATGVGKTLAARAICEAVTGTEENLKRIDMSEYQREHTDQRLIGPPPGYVGHLEGGQLTNWVLEKPYSVVLIDEVEKAHERILDIFLQILEGARLTDGKGQTVDLSETILIFTSNIGTAEAKDQNLDRNSREAVENHYRSHVERFFWEDLERPEIFNRLKVGIVVFNYIGEDVARGVIAQRLRDIMAGVATRSGGKLSIQFDPQNPDDARIIDELLARTNYREYGLRDVNNTLHDHVAGAVARLLDRQTTRRDWRFRWNPKTGRVEVRPAEGTGA